MKLNEQELQYVEALSHKFGSDFTPIWGKEEGEKLWTVGVVHPDDASMINADPFTLFAILIEGEEVTEGYKCTKEEAIENLGAREQDIDFYTNILKNYIERKNKVKSECSHH